MLTPVYKRGSRLLRVWSLLFGVQAFLFALACLIVSISGESGWWIFNFLSLTKPSIVRLSLLGLIINIAIISFDIYSCNQMNKELVWGLTKPNSFKEEKALKTMKQYLKTIIIMIIVSIFLQIINGVLWWIIGLGILSWKYLFYREFKVLDKYKSGSIC